MIVREERIGGQRLILGDCLQVMPLLGKVDACLTDPPYGIGTGKARAGRGGKDWGVQEWDKATLVACQRLGRNGTGIELDPEYFDIACKRVDEATRQVDLFIEPPKPAPTQGDLI